MISKGTTHNNGARLAEYMTASKEGERAELWELRDFGATNIKDAFRDVQIMAGATKAEQPLFHVQVRNREGEVLTRKQFEYAADRIERMLGLTGQPRAITFHTYEHNDDQHMHVAWSRIDQDTMTAIPMPFYWLRLKKISRELELHFGLEPVTNHREGNIKFAPTRAEHEQARRLGFDVHEVRNTIRDLWDRSDSGRSFQAALEHEGFALAQGERRDFLVIDPAGGLHTLGKRILDVTASKIRERLSDISRDDLPSVEMARALMPERTEERTPEQAKRQERTEPVWDRDVADRAWQEAVINAAIDKEKAERNFVEPGEKEPQAKQRQKTAGSRKKEWPVMPPTSEPIRTAPEYHFEDAARNTTRNRTYTPPKELKGMSKRIMIWVQALWNDPDQIPTKVKSLSAVLDEQGIALARVTKDEADRSHREAEFAKAVGRYAPRLKEGEIVAVTEPPLEYRRNGEIVIPNRIHKLDQKAAEIFVAELDKPKRVQSIEATKLMLRLGSSGNTCTIHRKERGDRRSDSSRRRAWEPGPGQFQTQFRICKTSAAIPRSRGRAHSRISSHLFSDTGTRTRDTRSSTQGNGKGRQSGPSDEPSECRNFRRSGACAALVNSDSALHSGKRSALLKSPAPPLEIRRMRCCKNPLPLNSPSFPSHQEQARKISQCCLNSYK